MYLLSNSPCSLMVVLLLFSGSGLSCEYTALWPVHSEIDGLELSDPPLVGDWLRANENGDGLTGSGARHLVVRKPFLPRDFSYALSGPPLGGTFFRVYYPTNSATEIEPYVAKYNKLLASRPNDRILVLTGHYPKKGEKGTRPLLTGDTLLKAQIIPGIRGVFLHEAPHLPETEKFQDHYYGDYLVSFDSPLLNGENFRVLPIELSNLISDAHSLNPLRKDGPRTLRELMAKLRANADIPIEQRRETDAEILRAIEIGEEMGRDMAEIFQRFRRQAERRLGPAMRRNQRDL